MFNMILGCRYFAGTLLQPPPLMMAEDPWNGREGNGGRKKDQPPDLDEFFAKLIRRKPAEDRKGNGSGGKMPSFPFQFNGKMIALLIFILLGLWLASGAYTVKERENGVVTFFGRYQKTTKSGLNWHWPYPLGKVEKVDVQSIATMRVGEFKTQKGSISTKGQREGQMLTKDENIVEIGAAVQYRVRDAKAYLYNANAPVEVLRDVVTSAIREVVGANDVDDVLKDRRNEWPQQARQIIVKTIDAYDIGIEIVAFELQDARAPAEVQDAFEDAVRAREDEERLRLEAQAYARERLPVARGEAEKRLQQAKAYAVEVSEKARADASKFEALLTAYELDKPAMRRRLYLDAISDVFARNRKIVVGNDEVRPILNLGGEISPAVREIAVENAAADSGGGKSSANPPHKPRTDDMRFPANLRTRDKLRNR